MDEETSPTRHQLANAEQKISSLKNALRRAADELDELANAAGDETAIDRARRKADLFRRAADS